MIKFARISRAICATGGGSFMLALNALVAAAAVLAAGIAAAQSPTATPTPSPIPKGSVAVSVNSGQVEIWSNDGTTLLQTLNNNAQDITTGSAFDSSGNFYVTGFSDAKVWKFDPAGNLLGTFGSGFSDNPESILFDAAGNVFVGQAQAPGSSPTGTIYEFDSNGNPLAQFAVAVEERGTDWIDLAADQCTMHYTSEGKRILRYNVCTNQQLSDFNIQPLPGSNAYAHRIMPDGGELVADSTVVERLDSSGNHFQTYTLPGSPSTLFGINLDPDGTSFWTGDLFSGKVYKVDIQTGNVLTQFTTMAGIADGIGVKGEIIVSQAGAQVSAPAPISVSGKAGQTIDAGNFTLTNTSAVSETFTTVTIGLTEPGLIASLDLSATFGETTSTGNSSSPSSSTVVTMSPPITLGGGEAANFSISVTLAGAKAAACPTCNRSHASAAPPKPTVMLAAMVPEGRAGWAGMILGLLLLIPILFPGTRAKWRRRLMCIALMALIGATSQIGCDPCPSCGHKPPPAPGSTQVSVDDAAGTAPNGTPVKVSGVPAQISTVTRE